MRREAQGGEETTGIQVCPTPCTTRVSEDAAGCAHSQDKLFTTLGSALWLWKATPLQATLGYEDQRPLNHSSCSGTLGESHT